MKESALTLITGGSRGIGLAIAEELTAAGYGVLLVARNKPRLNAAARKLRASRNVTVETFAADLASASGVKSLESHVRKAGLRISSLVLNAGIFLEGSAVTGAREDLERTLAANVLSVFSLTQSFIAHLKRDKRSRVVIIGSTAALEPYPVGAMYGVSKWALRGYACNLRAELRKHRIGVTLITPGGTFTDLWAGDDIDPNRLMAPSDVARAVRLAFDVSERAVIEEIVLRPMLGDIHS